MPKRYEFHSKLSPEEVFVRLAARSGWDHTRWGGSLHRKWIEFGRTGSSGFYLDVVAERDIDLRKRRTHFFEGTVEKREEGSVIKGGFPRKWGSWIPVILFLLLVGDILLKTLLGWQGLEDLVADVVSVGAAVAVIWLVWRTWSDTLADRVLRFMRESLLES